MRRWKVWGVVLALPALPAVILGWAQLAAVAAIDRLEREVDADIARRRAEGYPRPPLFDDPQPGDAVDAYRRAWTRARPLSQKKSVTITPEETRSAARLCAEDVALALRAAAFHRDRDFESGMRRMHDDGLPELVVLLLAGAEEEVRAGNAVTALRHLTALTGVYADTLRGVETYGLPGIPLFDLPFELWRRVLAGPPLPAAELERALRALDRTEASLPTAFDALRHQHDLERVDLVLAYRGRQSNWASDAELAWKHAGSRALLTCELLRALERQKEEIDLIARLPIQDRVAAGRTHDREYFDGPQIGEGRLWMGIQESLWRDARTRLQLGLMRAATAIAWHQAETGRLPAALEELVPRRLPEIPVCPMSGAPFRYADGRLWAFGFDRDDDGGRPVPEDKDYEGDGDILWTLKRP